jgi:hypothetical protein
MRGIGIAYIVAALSVSVATAGNHNNNDMGGHSDEAVADCYNPTAHFDLGSPHLEKAIRVAKNGTCNSTMRGSVVSDFRVAQRPEHGVVGQLVSGVFTGWAYRPADNYVGNDHFVLSFTIADQRHNSLNVDESVSVEVVDSK